MIKKNKKFTASNLTVSPIIGTSGEYKDTTNTDALPGMLPKLDDLGKAAHSYKASDLAFLKASTEKSNAAKHLIQMLEKHNKRSIRIGTLTFMHRKSKECIVIKKAHQK